MTHISLRLRQLTAGFLIQDMQIHATDGAPALAPDHGFMNCAVCVM